LRTFKSLSRKKKKDLKKEEEEPTIQSLPTKNAGNAELVVI
jgi:hypothetical protein